MRKVIWEYNLVFTVDGQNVMMPADARILTAQVQSNTICLWAYVNPDAPLERRVIEILATGQWGDDEKRVYIASVQVASLVWHIFEKL